MGDGVSFIDTLLGRKHQAMIGLDISSSGVKLVELSQAGSGEFILDRFASESFEKGWIAERLEFWAIFAAILTISCLGCLYLFGFTFWFYEYPHGGNFWGMLLAVPIYVSCIIGLAMLVGSLVDMPERVGHLIVATSVPLFLLTGTAWPHAAMPEWMQWFAWTLPSTHGVQMFVQLNQMGVPTSVVVPKLIYLATVGAILLALSYYRLVMIKPIKQQA